MAEGDIIGCTHLAIQTMQQAKKPGVIINLGSASGLYPMYADPIYSASKGGVVMFTRSLALYKRQGIRINVLCPEFVQTDLASKLDPKFIDLVGGFLPVEMVVKGAFELISDETKAGSCLWISKRRGLEYWPTPAEEAKYRVRPLTSRRKSSFMSPLSTQIPQSFEKIVVHTLNHDFRRATSVISAPLRFPLKPDHVLLKVIYAGVNASDVNFSSGRYFSGDKKDIKSRLPFDAGFEVVATCGGKEKAKLLKDLGVDRVIDYKEENIKTVLKAEFPEGVDIVYESVGGEMFDLCLNALAKYGRLVVIGMISQYQGDQGWKPRNYTGLCEKILNKSQTVAGFFLVQYAHLWQQHLDKLVDLYSLGKLKVAVDPKPFLGVNSVADAVDYLHSGKSVGKVVVCIDPSFSQQLAKL
ncbi:unnamed protein product [Fraxinus pennsylvanica]|uniref:Enoyl reductase (ER) domain-containing protein n=1 Tax=Fraxinus pennsylvanica TaxID=56036 RepID=A0AAD2AHK7_9LAMI|nr:unnamed protein product [Fraxinus pennsylvanica]